MKIQLSILSFFVFTHFGCSLFSEENNLEESYIITISSSSISASNREPILITVTIENTLENTISWGSGSSSCQLSALVRINKNDFQLPINRYCVTDMVNWELNPGQTRSESWNWVGEYDDGSLIDTLGIGNYSIYGTAGDWISKFPVEVEIIE